MIARTGVAVGGRLVGRLGRCQGRRFFGDVDAENKVGVQVHIAVVGDGVLMIGETLSWHTRGRMHTIYVVQMMKHSAWSGTDKVGAK